jgi:integrase
MAGRQAKICADIQIQALVRACDQTRYPHRNKVVVLLGFKAGLRAMEIALIRRWHVMDAGAKISDAIHLENKICKKGSGRTIPINNDLAAAITYLFDVLPGLPEDPLILSERAMIPEAMIPEAMRPNSIVHLFDRLIKKVGLIGCSSHSGRRTFGTRAARKIVEAGGSLRDVQQLLGHRSLLTTQSYIDGDEDAKKKVVNLL